jgi:hypothetical protein
MILRKDFDDWVASALSRTFLNRFDSNTNLVVSTTWWDISYVKKINDWLEKSDQNKVLLFGMFDPFFRDPTLIQNDRIREILSDEFCFWLVACGFYFHHYDIDTVLPKEFNYNFLCYQRKMPDERIMLYERLKDLNGLITRGDRPYSFNGDINYPNSEDVFGKLSVVNDIWSLGNIDIWNRSFLIIVSETKQNTYSSVFLSEKSYKPIIGMRPFLSYGHPKLSERLKSLGFETFDDDFGYKISPSHDENSTQLRDIISQLDSLDKLYVKLLPKILHNRNHFKTAYRNELVTLDNLVERYRNW